MARKKRDPGEEIVQDNTRESFMAVYCGLKGSGKRAGRDVCDEAGNSIELKSTTGESVSTARDVGLHTIKTWQQEYWIFSVGHNFKGSWMMRELYIAHPDNLEPWFAEIAKKLRNDAKVAETVLKAARARGVPDETLARADYLFKRGATINNPHIPMALIRKRATKVTLNDPDAARKEVKGFIKRNPLTSKSSG